MKKGLLSILAGALVVVGCQNYDDQFDNLESQISALASTVAGLSQVQSDLASLSGTVNSLASTVSGLGSQIDTAVADGLSDIQSDIEAIEAAVADVASSEAVDALADAVADAQTDLTDLLEASSVFTGDVIVNSVSTLDAYHKMGAGLNIVNGNVNITVSTAMDQAKVQELVDNILTVVKDLTYTSAASSIAETTFDNLTGVQSITITQGGGIRFPNLVSATYIDMKDDFESTVDVIHFGSLTSVTQFETDGVADIIQFTKATELHLTSLEYYPGGAITIETDEGAAMPFALDDIDADGDTLEDGLTLTITGPASFSTDKIADGTFDFTDVATISLTDFKGSVTIGGDVESFTSNSLVSLSVDSGTKIETVDVTGVVNPDATTAATKLGPTINLDTLGDLETVSIAGIAESVNLGSNGNLTSVTISADVSGSITIDNNSDLTAITLTGATASALDVDTNADLTSLTVDLTWGNSGTGTTVDGDLDVTDNASLESLTVSSNNLENLTVTGNDELSTLDFTGVTAIGATGSPEVNIYDNDLTATKLTDTDDGATDKANGASGDLGSITTTSGMETLKDYLTAVAADADSTAAVYFDTVESFIEEDDDELTDKVWASGSQPDAIKVLVLTAKDVQVAGQAASKAKFSQLLTGIDATKAIEIYANGVKIVPELDLTVNNSVNAANIASAANIATADAAGVTLSATSNASAALRITFAADGAAASEVSTSGAKTAAAGAVHTSTVLTITLSTGESVQISNNTNIASISTKISTAWNAKYPSASAEMVRWTLASGDAADGSIIFQAKDKGTSQIDATVTVALSGSTATSGSVTNLGWKIGNDNANTISTGDNYARGAGVVVTLEAETAGDLASEIGAVTNTQLKTANSYHISTTATTAMLTTSYNPNVTASSNEVTATKYFVSESRSDVRIPDEALAEVADAAVSFSRVGWLN